MESHSAQIRKEVLSRLDLDRDTSDQELKNIIAYETSRYLKGKAVSLKEKAEVEKEIFDSLRKMDVLQELIDDPQVTEIMVNGPNNIFYEKEGIIHQYHKKFLSEEKLMDLLQTIVSRHNRVVNQANPMVDTRLADGSRVHIVLSPVAIDGSVLTIRRFPEAPISMEKMIEYRSISREVANFLERMVRAKYNIFISGGTGSGKTTFLNALSNYIPSGERVITIEDSAELRIQGIKNLVRLETRNANMEGVQPITIRDLIRASLRMRPDRIVVGECRGAEALDMLQSMNTGHDGSLSTAHSNSCEDMIHRLETMVMMGMNLPVDAIRQQIASGIDLMIHLARARDGSRKVMEIKEVCGVEDHQVVLHSLYHREQEELKKVGELKNTWKLQLYGGHEEIDGL